VLTVEQLPARLHPCGHRRPPTPERVAYALAARQQRLEKRLRLGDLSVEQMLAELLPMAGGASFFNLVLDTTAPGGMALQINGGAAYATSRDVTAALTTTDSPTTGYQMKLWGNVDLAYNANIQDTEANSTWITYNAAQAVRLSTGDGSKTVSGKIRDDVWNESSIPSDSITLDTTVPVVTIQSSYPDVTKVSKVSGKRTCTVRWQSDTHIQAWKVKVVSSGASLESTGTTIGTTNGSTGMTGGALNAATNQDSVIDGRDLEVASAGDGTKVVKIFVQDDAGNWSVA
jgi:hypothetical protein